MKSLGITPYETAKNPLSFQMAWRLVPGSVRSLHYCMNKASRLIKRYIALILVLLFSIESFAAVVGDNDGAAFITKAEFDSMKNDFQSQLDRYNSSLDNKIDGAIASYLAGVRVGKTVEQPLLLYGGRTLGLLENFFSRPYVEGIVGGNITIHSFVTQGGNDDWINGAEARAQGENITMAVPTYFALCYHQLSSTPVPFRYVVADYQLHNGGLIFDLVGYCSVIERLTSSILRKIGGQDNTAEGEYSIGLCSGTTPQRWALDAPQTVKSGTIFSLCELKSKGSYADTERGAANSPRHNTYQIGWNETELDSTIERLNDYAFISNIDGTTSYAGIRVKPWSGVNMTTSVQEPHTESEFVGWGWNLKGSPGSESNYHLKMRTSSNFAYPCGYGAYDRYLNVADPENTPGAVYPTNPHGNVPTDAAFHRLYKADVDDVCRVNNMYSSELADVIKEKLQSKIITVNFEGTQRDLAPLYLGLPIVDVNVDDIVELHLNLLDTSTYDIGFYIDGFDNVAVQNSSFANAGCQVDGSPNNRKQITGPNGNAIIKIRINKKGILFLKYGATGTNAQSIQLPLKCSVTTN